MSSSPPPGLGQLGAIDVKHGDSKPSYEAPPGDTKDFTVVGVSDRSSGSDSEDSDEDALAKNPFLDPVAAERWKQVYEDAQYECRHVFDPTLTWTEEEEKKIVRKLDVRVCLWAVSFSPV